MRAAEQAPRAALEFRGVSTQGGSVRVRHLNFTLFRGEYVALAGADHSGYREIRAILDGACPHYSGEVLVNGESYRARGLKYAFERGVFFVTNVSALVETQTIAENLFLNHHRRRGFEIVQDGALRRRAELMMDEYALPLRADARAVALPEAMRTIVEMVKAAEHGAKLIVMQDVMTSATQSEIRLFHSVAQQLQRKGVTLFLLCNQLLDVQRGAKRFYLLSGSGQLARVAYGQNYSKQQFRAVLSESALQHGEKPFTTRREALRAENITLDGKLYANFSVGEGECVGILLNDPGMEDILCALAGQRRFKGSVFCRGQRVNINSIRDALRLGIGVLPADLSRLYFPYLSWRQNIEMSFMRILNRVGVLSRKRRQVLNDDAKTLLRSMRQEFQMDENDPTATTLIRFMLYPFRVLIVLQPGVYNDEIKQRMMSGMLNRVMANGTAVIIASKRLRELEQNCSRIFAGGA